MMLVGSTSTNKEIDTQYDQAKKHWPDPYNIINQSINQSASILPNTKKEKKHYN